MLGHVLRIDAKREESGAIILRVVESLKPDSFKIEWVRNDVIISGGDDRGVLYGAFALLRAIATGEALGRTIEQSAPLLIAEVGGALSRVDDVRQHDRRQNTAETTAGAHIEDLRREDPGRRQRRDARPGRAGVARTVTGVSLVRPGDRRCRGPR